MVTLSPADKKNMERLLWGTFLCVLLFMFAMAAKTAVYQTHNDEVQVLTAAKVWPGKESIQANVSQVPVAPAVCLMVCVFMLSTAPRKLLYAIYPAPARMDVGGVYSPPIAVRPPPSLS